MSWQQILASVGKGVYNGAKTIVGKEIDSRYSEKMMKKQAQLQDYYNQQAEKRADARNREMLLEQPMLTAQGRRAAGLNPYGDATLPGMQSQSSTNVDSSGFMAGSLNDMIALEQLRINRDLADAEIRNKDASTDLTLENIVGVKLSNDIKAIEKEATAFNFEQDKAKAPLILEQLSANISKLEEERRALSARADVDEKQLTVMDESINKLIKEQGLIEAQISLAESGVYLNQAQVQNLRDRLIFDKQVEERVKAQGLAGLRIEAATLGLDKDKFDWEQTAREIEQSLRSEGIDVDWSSLGVNAISTIVAIIAFVLTKNPTGSKAAAKTVSTVVRRVLRTAK